MGRHLEKKGQLLFRGVALFVILGALHSWHGFAVTGGAIAGIGIVALLAAMLSAWLTSPGSPVRFR